MFDVELDRNTELLTRPDDSRPVSWDSETYPPRSNEHELASASSVQPGPDPAFTGARSTAANSSGTERDQNHDQKRHSSPGLSRFGCALRQQNNILIMTAGRSFENQTSCYIAIWRSWINRTRSPPQITEPSTVDLERFV